ncbi:MAG: YbjQ family protein, partial [Sulfurovaceae bacterium]
MNITNLEYLPNKEIVEHYGVVSGSTVRAKHIGRDLMAGIKNVFGGELKGYTELLSEARDEAIDRMINQAQSMGANAILNV